MVESPVWVRATVGAWKPMARLGGSEWAERQRVLSREESPSPGPWRSVPWQRELLDALADPLVDWLVILKAAQMGISEVVRCAIGRWALLDPGDVLWVMTTEDAARKAMRKLQAMFRSTPTLRPLLSTRRSDSTLLELVLTTGMRIVIGWAGSAQSLASDPFRYVILDEVGKYRWNVQGEASPVDLAKERTKVYGRRAKIVLLSSPKHDDDLICTAHREVRDRRVFTVPCPSCSLAQPIDWSSVRWPGGEPSKISTDREERSRLADEVERDQSAWVECRSCRGKILPHRAQWANGSGWAPEAGGEIGARRRAYHVPEFFHWETTISGLVAKFLRCMTPSAQQGFFNGSLGVAYKSDASLIHADLFAARAQHAARVVPAWATTVIVTADTQLAGWWYMTRAWGRGGRSRLLDWGWVDSEERLVEQCVNVTFAIEGKPGAQARPFVLGIDTGGGMLTPDGSRTQDVYRFILRTPGSYAIKGEGDRESLHGVPWRTSKVKFSQQYGEVELDLNLLNKNYWADELATLIRADPIRWEECEGAESASYSRQMASEQKVLVTGATGSKWLWQKRSKGAANHLWDCARYQCWAATFAHVEGRIAPTWSSSPLKPEDEEDQERARKRQIRTRYS